MDPVAFYAHFFTVFVIVAQVVVVALRARVREWRILVASGIGVAALCLPFLPFFMVNSDGSQILHVAPSDLDDLFELFRLFAGASMPLLVAYAVLASEWQSASQRTGHRERRIAAERAGGPSFPCSGCSCPS